MTTDEIASRLDCMLHHPRLSDICEDCDAVQETKQTLTTAIQTVKLLEQIKADMHGNCDCCAYAKIRASELPCANCINCIASDSTENHWEFRWPLGKEANHETH